MDKASVSEHRVAFCSIEDIAGDCAFESRRGRKRESEVRLARFSFILQREENGFSVEALACLFTSGSIPARPHQVFVCYLERKCTTGRVA